MNIGLLESVRKYRPREGRDPLEDFITEAFAWILSNHSDFSEFFIKEINKEPGMGLPAIDGKDCKWITQYYIKSCFLDMVCISNKNAIVFEHKTWSPLHDNQLEEYKKRAAEFSYKSKIVLITATQFQHDQNPDLTLYWHDVYDLIDTWKETKTDPSFIFNDFLGLLKSEGMGPLKPISHESIIYYYASTDLKKNISGIIKQVENKDWSEHIPENKKKDYKLFIENETKNVDYSNVFVYGERWGRIGLHLMDTWRPGIFVGILLDGKDHFTKPRDKEKGPDFCLIFSFDLDIQDQYPSNQHYIELVKKLSEATERSNNGWEFYNHLDDEDAADKNKWHPIHIRKPMLDVFAGTSTVEEQADKFYETANELIKMVTDEECFWKLRDEYERPASQNPTE